MSETKSGGKIVGSSENSLCSEIATQLAKISLYQMFVIFFLNDFFYKIK